MKFGRRRLGTERSTAIADEVGLKMASLLEPSLGDFSLRAHGVVDAAIRKPANAVLWGERQPRIANRHLVGFGDYLRDLCGDLAATLGGSNRPLLSCAAVDELLPIATAIRLGFVADELITNAFRHAFPGGRTGRIAVLFTADAGGWQLTVEDSGLGMRDQARGAGAGLRIAGDLVDELGGRLEMPSMIGGTRCVAVLPRR